VGHAARHNGLAWEALAGTDGFEQRGQAAIESPSSERRVRALGVRPRRWTLGAAIAASIEVEADAFDVE
jgi:hypothetical protein